MTGVQTCALPIWVRICEDDTDAMIITKKGQSIRFMTSSIRNTGRTSIGVRGIRLSKEDEVVSTDLVKNNEYLLVVSENGYGKKTLIQRYNTQNRGGKGVRTYNISEKTGCLISTVALQECNAAALAYWDRKLNENYKALKALCGYAEEADRVRCREAHRRSEERRVGKECRSRWSPYH